MAGQDAHVALRGQKTARTVGERLAPLEEVVESVGSHGRFWLPRCRRWPCRCWPARQANPWTTPPSNSSSITPLRCGRSWRRRRGRRRCRRHLRGSAPRSVLASLSPPPSMRPGTGPPLPPPRRGGRRKRGGGESSLRLLFLVVDVPVPFNDKFQQFFEFFVPQVQFLDRMVDIPVVQQRQVPTVFFTVLVQFLGKVVVPVLRNDRDWSDSAENRAGAAGAVNRRSSTSLSCRRGKSPRSCLFGKPWRLRSCSMPGGRCPFCAGRACHARC